MCSQALNSSLSPCLLYSVVKVQAHAVVLTVLGGFRSRLRQVQNITPSRRLSRGFATSFLAVLFGFFRRFRVQFFRSFRKPFLAGQDRRASLRSGKLAKALSCPSLPPLKRLWQRAFARSSGHSHHSHSDPFHSHVN